MYYRLWQILNFHIVKKSSSGNAAGHNVNLSDTSDRVGTQIEGELLS